MTLEIRKVNKRLPGSCICTTFDPKGPAPGLRLRVLAALTEDQNLVSSPHLGDSTGTYTLVLGILTPALESMGPGHTWDTKAGRHVCICEHVHPCSHTQNQFFKIKIHSRKVLPLRKKGTFCWLFPGMSK